MRYFAHVRYKCSWEDKSKSVACFSQVTPQKGGNIKYSAKICPPLEEQRAAVKWWCEFTKEIFPCVKYKINNKTVTFEVECGDSSYRQVLAVLTLCRYVQEFPEILLATYEKRGTVEESFAAFQDASYSTKCYYYDNLWGHGLCYVLKKTEPISLGRFRDNYAKNTATRIQDYFTL